jgi:hypothetical protein
MACGALVLSASALRVGSQNVLGECALTFDDAAALGAIPDQAAGTFAASYRMGCSSHSLNVEPGNWPHFHLVFEDPAIGECFAEDNGINGLGKIVGGQCVAPDWDHEPRYLVSHKEDKWTKIWLEDGSSHQPRAFDLRRIHVGGSGSPAIQLWFREQDGDWWFWSSLKAGKNWKVEQWAKNVMEVRIRTAASSSGPYTIRNAYVHQ